MTCVNIALEVGVCQGGMASGELEITVIIFETMEQKEQLDFFLQSALVLSKPSFPAPMEKTTFTVRDPPLIRQSQGVRVDLTITNLEAITTSKIMAAMVATTFQYIHVPRLLKAANTAMELVCVRVADLSTGRRGAFSQVTLMAELLFANMVDAQADCDDGNDKQHKSIIEALRAAAPEWTFEQINFVAGRCGAVVEDDFYNKLEKLNAHARKQDKILWANVQRICEAHDTVMRSYYQQIHWSSGADATTSMENIGKQVYV